LSETIVTRPARKSDASDVALLVNVATHGGIAQGWAAEEAACETYSPIEVGRRKMLSETDIFSWRSATIAEGNGEVAGMLLGYREPDRPTPAPADTPPFLLPLLELEAEASGKWFISMLGVYPEWRGQGVGSALLDVAERKCAETGGAGLALITEDVNEGARRLYERRGFRLRAKRPMGKFPWGGAGSRDWLLMVKE
jgi:ribosomal protein S18 acetylase RimI-like enzyme